MEGSSEAVRIIVSYSGTGPESCIEIILNQSLSNPSHPSSVYTLSVQQTLAFVPGTAQSVLASAEAAKSCNLGGKVATLATVKRRPDGGLTMT